MDESTRKTAARAHLDAAEAWIRRLIELKLRTAFGESYLEPGAIGCPMIGDGLRKRIASRVAAESGRYARRIDGADFDDALKILLYDELYWVYFEDALDDAYAQSRDLARSFLRRLRDIRNKLAHGGVCSTRDNGLYYRRIARGHVSFSIWVLRSESVAIDGPSFLKALRLICVWCGKHRRLQSESRVSSFTRDYHAFDTDYLHERRAAPAHPPCP
jgi:hypothetical protein